MTETELRQELAGYGDSIMVPVRTPYGDRSVAFARLDEAAQERWVRHWLERGEWPLRALFVGE